MLYQTDFAGINYDIEHFGCFLMSIIKISRPELLINEDKKTILEIYQKLIESKAIGAECYINNIHSVVAMFNPKIIYIGDKTPDYVTKDGELVIEKWTRPKYTHFVTSDYDPIKGGSYTKKLGKCVEKRIFRVV